MPNLACKIKYMSISNNLTETTRTTLVQAQGLDKPHRPAILSLVKVTTPDIKKTLVHTWGLDKLINFYLSRLQPWTLDSLL